MKLVIKCVVSMLCMVSLVGYASTKYKVQARVNGDKDLYEWFFFKDEYKYLTKVNDYNWRKL